MPAKTVKVGVRSNKDISVTLVSRQPATALNNLGSQRMDVSVQTWTATLHGFHSPTSS